MSLPGPIADRLAALAPDQRAAALAPSGPVLCVAPAGSGKTTTLVARVAATVARGTDPDTVCAVTFNRRAAEELRERLALALTPVGVGPDAVRVHTFHALGREVLEEAGVDVARLADREEVLRALLGDAATPGRLRRLDDALSGLKLDRGLDLTGMREAQAGAAPSDRVLLTVAIRYQEALRADGRLDFDDLVAEAVRVLERDERLLARWQARCRHLLVDEVQDLDRTQLRLALLLAGQERNVFLVGDDDQTIYAWRLADVKRTVCSSGYAVGIRKAAGV